MWNLKKIQLNTKNTIIIAIKHQESNQISALNNPYRVNMPLNKWTKLKRRK